MGQPLYQYASWQPADMPALLNSILWGYGSREGLGNISFF